MYCSIKDGLASSQYQLLESKSDFELHKSTERRDPAGPSEMSKNQQVSRAHALVSPIELYFHVYNTSTVIIQFHKVTDLLKHYLVRHCKMPEETSLGLELL